MENDLVFEKKFTFKNEGWILPPLCDWYTENSWSICELQALKCELNATKSLLNNKDIHLWGEHTSYTNKAGLVISQLRKKINPEFLTQAWCKFYEILETYPVIPVKQKLKTYHLCEAPGAFIAALNHYLHSRFADSIEWHWMANTLNPYYEETSCRNTIVDDRLLLQTLEKWNFGVDNTGNILNHSFFDSISQAVQVEGQRDLVTADGSIDCQDVPEEQESVVAGLHFFEAIIASLLLSSGGSFVIKMFTFFECSSICLLYLLNNFFETVHVFKPATSKPGNSEVYVVCLNYFGENAKFLADVKQLVLSVPIDKAVFRLTDIPQSFLQQVLTCCRCFKGFQEETIRKNVQLFEKIGLVEREILDSDRVACAKGFLVRFNLHPIGKFQRLVDATKLTHSQSFDWALQDNKGIRGSLNERRQEKCKSWTERLQTLECRVCELANRLPWNAGSSIATDYIHRSFEEQHVDFQAWLVIGRPLRYIRSSKFCPILPITWWNELLQNSQVMNGGVPPVPQWPTEGRKYLNDISFSGNAIFVSPDGHGGMLEHSNFPIDSSRYLDCYPPWEMMLAETTRRKCFLDGCLYALRCARPGQAVGLRLTTVLTRFTVGVLYLLASCFSSMQAVASPLNGSLVYLWLENFHYDDHVESVKRHLETIGNRLDSDSKEMTVLQIVPMQNLCQEPFYSFVYNWNLRFMITSLLDIIRLEKEFIQKH